MIYKTARNTSKEKGIANAQRLDAWIKSTPLAEVPRNVSGTSAKTTICRILKIPPSTIQSNPLIARSFEDLDKKLGGVIASEPAVTASAIDGNAASVALERDRLLAECKALQLQVSRLEYLERTGGLL
jgi:hypothetical protein